jgi:hypothetical protein
MAILKVDHPMLETLIEKTFEIKRPLCIFGTTGIGKSMTVQAKAENLAKQYERKFVAWNKITKKKKLEILKEPKKYFVLIDKRLSEFDPSDLRGLPDFGKAKEFVEWKAPLWLYYVTQPDAMGIIFFDEMNLAPPSIQSAAYQLINDRELDEMALADGIHIVTAGNRIEDKANVYEMAKPLQNRFLHCDLQTPVIAKPHDDDWIAWAIKNNLDMRIVSYLKFKPGMLFNFEDNSKERAFPTPRTWEFTSDLITNVPCDTESQRKFVKQLVSTSVGSGAAHEFVAFLKLRERIDLENILDNPEKAKELEGEWDLQHSLLGLVSEWYRIHHKKKDLEKVLDIAVNVDPEFGIIMLKFVKRCHPEDFERNAPKCKTWKFIAKNWSKFIIG